MGPDLIKGIIMLNTYNDARKQFYINVIEFIRRVYKRDFEASLDIMSGLKDMSLHSSWFHGENLKDYNAYFAFLDVYHAICNYYEYNAKYNKKDEDLEKALRKWYKLTLPKQTMPISVERFTDIVYKRGR